jgi:hypothetical protein
VTDQDPLAAIPELAPAASTDSAQELAELWRNIIPWDDLNAKGPPDRYLKLGQEILPTLAILAAQGEDAPHLLKVDAASRLLTSAVPNPIQRLTDPITAGDQALNVDDPSPFPGGSHIFITSASGGGASGPYLVYEVTGNQLYLGREIIVPYVPGDLVVGYPSYVAVGEAAQDRAADIMTVVVPAVGAGGQIVFPATPFHVWSLAYLDATLRQNGAAIGQAAVTVWDGPAGTGNRLWTGALIVAATQNSMDRVSKDRLPIKAAPGNALTVDVPAAGATCQLWLSAGAWVGNALR